MRLHDRVLQLIITKLSVSFVRGPRWCTCCCVHAFVPVKDYGGHGNWEEIGMVVYIGLVTVCGHA